MITIFIGSGCTHCKTVLVGIFVCACRYGWMDGCMDGWMDGWMHVRVLSRKFILGVKLGM